MSAIAEQTNGRVTRNPLAPVPAPAAEAPAPQPAPIPPTLAAALSAFQGVVPPFKKSQTAEIASAKGSYAYDYADLGEILPVTGPLLAEFGLAWTSDPVAIDGMMWLNYELLHVSGESRPGSVPLGVPVNCKPQDLGSAITYMRRYAQSAQLNLATERDDDGGRAQGITTVVPANGQMPTATASAPSGGNGEASIGQQRMLNAKARDAKLSPIEFGNVIKVALGEEPSDSNDTEAAERYVDRELGRLPKELVDPVIAGIQQAREARWAIEAAAAKAASAAAEGSQS